ncbi:MAG: hypothetical protein OXG39_04835 [Chloroflexi bacterium]|nr:hypothetical protein [Chloroflexota bacterium]
MRKLNKLRDAFDLLLSIRDLTTVSRNYRWQVRAPGSFYLEAEYAEVNLSRSEDNHLDVHVRLRAPMSWKLATEKDDAGVYVVLKRKPLIGNIGRALIHARVPRGIHISLQLENSHLCLKDLVGTLDLPPET